MKVEKILLQIFHHTEEKRRVNLIRNVLSLTAYFNAHLSISLPEKDIKSISKIISRFRSLARHLPVIEIHSMSGDFIQQALHYAENLKVDVVVTHLNLNEKKTKFFGKKHDLSKEQQSFIEKIHAPVLLLPEEMNLFQSSFQFLKKKPKQKRIRFSKVEQVKNLLIF